MISVIRDDRDDTSAGTVISPEQYENPNHHHETLWYNEQLREHGDYAEAARRFCPAGEEFLHMLPAFPALKAELRRCGDGQDLAYLNAQAIGDRIREGAVMGYRTYWEKASAENLICAWFGLLYYYSLVPQYDLRIIYQGLTEYMEGRQDVKNLCKKEK